LGISTPKQTSALVSQEPNNARSVRVVVEIARGFMHKKH